MPFLHIRDVTFFFTIMGEFCCITSIGCGLADFVMECFGLIEIVPVLQNTSGALPKNVLEVCSLLLYSLPGCLVHRN